MKKQPILFLGHGSPMNVISENSWTREVSRLGASLSQPRGILMVSAHWVTRGLKIHDSASPKTIHDFRGFPAPLYDVRYPALGNHELAARVNQLLPEAELTSDWGFDHGTWGVLNFLFPQADIPVTPISLNAESTPSDFYELGRRLQVLREENILIIGSGNLVHNLHDVDFQNENSVFPWAQSFDQQVKELTEKGDLKSLLDWPQRDSATFRRAHPSFEHWAPYLVCLGAAQDFSKVEWIFEGIQNGSVSMRSAFWNP